MRFAAYLILILLFGVILRFYRIDELSVFRSDQAIELGSTADILHGKVTLIGIKTSISEVRNGAVMYYLLAPFLYLTNYDPIAGGFLQTTLQLLGAVVIYKLVKEFYQGKLALFAAFFVVVSPVLINYSRQTLLAFYPFFFSCLALWVAIRIIKRPYWLTSLIFGSLLGFGLQIHYSFLATLIFAVCLPMFFFKNRRQIIQYYLFVATGFLIGFSPMILFEFRHQFFNSQMLFKFLLKGNIATGGQIFANTTIFMLYGLSQYVWPQWLSLILFFKNKNLRLLEKISILQIASLAIFVLFFVREKNLHYLLPGLPGLLILVTTRLEKFSGKILILVALVYLVVNWKIYDFNDKHGLSLVGTKIASAIINNDVDTVDYNVAMVADQENRGLPLRYFLNLWNNPPLSVESYDKARVLYVLTEPDIDVLQVGLWEIKSFGSATIKNSWDIQNGFTLYRLEKANQL